MNLTYLNGGNLKKGVDFVVLNDTHPFVQPGAATIAFEASEILSASFDVEFWCASAKVIPLDLTSPTGVRIRMLKTKPWVNKVLAKRTYLMAYSEFLNFHRLSWLTFNLITIRPKILWIHQIGNQFPRTVILFAKLLNIKVIQTLHDFSPVAPGKIYPADIGIGASCFENSAEQDLFREIKTSSLKQGRLFSRFLRFRRFLIRFLFNHVNVVFAISQMQRDVLGLFGFVNLVVLPNGIAPCTCPLEDRVNQSNAAPRILFAGRAIGKGLERLLEAISKTSDVHVVLAGESNLNDLALRILPADRVHYEGVLSRNEIFSLIHGVDAVAVLSECFDVFPTITLESIAHGTQVVTTLNTGNASFSKKTTGITCVLPGKNDELLMRFIHSLGQRDSSKISFENPFPRPEQQIKLALEVLKEKTGFYLFL